MSIHPQHQNNMTHALEENQKKKIENKNREKQNSWKAMWEEPTPKANRHKHWWLGDQICQYTYIDDKRSSST